MGSESRDSIIKTAVAKVSSWFRTDWAEEQNTAEAAELRKQGVAHTLGVGQGTPAAALPRASKIVQKIAVLKETLELGPNLRSKIDKEQSLRALLVLVSDELLFRFSKLCEIGFLSSESACMLELLNSKVASVLACKDDARGLDLQEEVGRLTKENLSLRHKIKALQNHYVRTGVITERELALEKEIDSLRNLMRNQQQQLLVARKKGEQLADWQEMVHSLNAKNNLLNSKVEYQVRLLHSFTADQPKQQELLAMLKKLTEQNNQLKRDLEQQGKALRTIKPEAAGGQLKAVAELIEGNLQMHGSLEEQRDLLERAKKSTEVEDNLLDQIDQLTEENASLRNLYEVSDQLHRYAEAPEQATEGRLDEMASKLRAEQARLGETAKEREEMLQSASEETPASAILFRTCVKLRNEKRELVRENRLREKALQQEATEKQFLQKQLRQAAGLHKENIQLRGRLCEFERLTKIVNELTKQNELLKKERAGFQIKHERTSVELAKVNEKMGKITREYNALMTEYEKLFAEQ